MNIGMAVRRFGRVGGMEGVAYSFAHWLARAGHTVDVWTARNMGDAAGVRIRTLSVPGRGVLWKARSLRRALRGFSQRLRWFCILNAVVLVAHTGQGRAAMLLG